MRKKISIHYCCFEIRVNQLIEISNDFKERRKSLTSTIVHFKLKLVDRLIALIIISYNFKDTYTSAGALQTVNIHYEKVKMCRFSSVYWIFCNKFVQRAAASKRRNRVCTSTKECNKLDLTAAQYCCQLVDHNDWSRWFAISSSDVYAVPVTVLLVGLPEKTKQLNLDI
jgi:hypothetical protein